MDRSMISSAVAMAQIQKSIDLIANNMSNLSTTGYKSRNASFSSLLFQNMKIQPDKDFNLGDASPLGIREGTGAHVSDTQLVMEQGTLVQTERTLDLALTQPDRFFTVATPGKAPHYTRDGTFYLSPDAANPNVMNLVTASGQFVIGANGGKIQLPSQFDKVIFTADGQVQYKTQGGQTVNAGVLGIVAVKHPQLLQAQGDNTFTLPNLAALGLTQAEVMGPNGGAAVVRQGALEQSNVDMSEQMANLMTMERAYQFNARSLSIGNDMMGLINQLK